MTEAKAFHPPHAQSIGNVTPMLSAADAAPRRKEWEDHAPAAGEGIRAQAQTCRNQVEMTLDGALD